MNTKGQKKSLMNLDKLIKSREEREHTIFPISDEELCGRYEKLYTGAVSDVLRELCFVNQALPPEIHPLRDEMKVCGIAYTIKSSRDLRITGEMETRAHMLDDMPKNCVCVWETGGDNDVAHWGEIMTAVSIGKGARGAVIDGGLRDTRQVLELKFPVFYKYRTSNGTLSRCRIIDYNIPTKIGDVMIYPGDIIFGDIDGVVVVPREVAYEVLCRTEEIKKNEKEIRSWVEKGMLAEKVVEKGGYF